MLRVQDAGTHRTAQSRVLVLDTVLTEQAGVVPLPASSRSTLDAYSAVLGSKENLLSNTTQRTRQNQCNMNPVCLLWPHIKSNQSKLKYQTLFQHLLSPGNKGNVIFSEQACLFGCSELGACMLSTMLRVTAAMKLQQLLFFFFKQIS